MPRTSLPQISFTSSGSAAAISEQTVSAPFDKDKSLAARGAPHRALAEKPHVFRPFCAQYPCDRVLRNSRLLLIA